MSYDIETFKARIIALSDEGLDPDAVCRLVPCSRRYVQRTISDHAIDASGERRAANLIRQQTRDLKRAILAAGIHTSPKQHRLMQEQRRDA